MADRGKIRGAFYDELLTHASGSHTVTFDDGSTTTVTVDAGNVALQEAEQPMDLPTVVYNDTYQKLDINGAGAGADYVNIDSNGTVVDERWREYMQAQFIVSINASSDLYKEPIYESIRRGFGKYQHAPWDETDIHPDVRNVEVLGTSPGDITSTEETVRGESVEIRIEFYREYVFDTDVITKFSSEVDADTDSNTAGFGYITT